MDLDSESLESVQHLLLNYVLWRADFHQLTPITHVGELTTGLLDFASQENPYKDQERL
jgi:hypothetical protein